MNCPTSALEAKERAFLLAVVLGIETSGILSSFLTNWEGQDRVGGGQSDPMKALKATTSSWKSGGGSGSREAIEAGTKTTQKDATTN